MVEAIRKKMSQFDWQVCGIEYDGTPPVVRLDVPLPDKHAGYYELANRLFAIAEQLRTLPRQCEDIRAATLSAKVTLQWARQDLRRLRTEWTEDTVEIVKPPDFVSRE